MNSNQSETPSSSSSSSSFLYYEPAPYYENDHLDDLIFNQYHRPSQDDLQLSEQLQSQLSLKKAEEKVEQQPLPTPTENCVNMSELRAQVTALVGQLERILSQVQPKQKNNNLNIG